MADVYDFINKSYINHISIVKIINHLNFIMSLVFINKIYVIVLITGNNPITPKLLNIKDSVVAKNINIIFDFKSNLFL